MPLDDRAADEQPDPHAAVLRGVERIEQRIRALWRQAYADIADGQTDAIPVVAFASDEQMSRSIVHVHHRVRRVAEQIQDDLLELNAVAGDERETLGELGMEDHVMSVQVARRQRNDLARGLVQIERFERELLLAEECAQPRNHVGGAIAVANRTSCGLACTGDIGRHAIQHSKARAGVGDDARERLVDLVSDRRRQCAERGHPRHMGKLGTGFLMLRPLDGDAREMRHPADELLLQGRGRRRLTLINRERPQNISARRRDRRRPTRPQPMRQREWPECGSLNRGSVSTSATIT